MPASYNHYYEPFIGGAAVFLDISPARAFVNDVNEQLVNLYTQLKTAVDRVVEKVNEMGARPCDKELYHAICELYNKKNAVKACDAECAAIMIWINKRCFNGLYRVNSRGLFNVPYNNKVGGKSIDEDNIRAISEYLRQSDITITCLDFERACDGAAAA